MDICVLSFVGVWSWAFACRCVWLWSNNLLNRSTSCCPQVCLCLKLEKMRSPHRCTHTKGDCLCYFESALSSKRWICRLSVMCAGWNPLPRPPLALLLEDRTEMRLLAYAQAHTKCRHSDTLLCIIPFASLPVLWNGFAPAVAVFVSRSTQTRTRTVLSRR